jgi:hypothetical protein
MHKPKVPFSLDNPEWREARAWADRILAAHRRTPAQALGYRLARWLRRLFA